MSDLAEIWQQDCEDLGDYLYEQSDAETPGAFILEVLREITNNMNRSVDIIEALCSSPSWRGEMDPADKRCLEDIHAAIRPFSFRLAQRLAYLAAPKGQQIYGAEEDE